MILPAPLPDIEVADFDTELVVLVPRNRRAHLLEPLMSLLYDSCRNGQSMHEVVSEVTAATGWDGDETESWLIGAVELLRRSGILAA